MQRVDEIGPVGRHNNPAARKLMVDDDVIACGMLPLQMRRARRTERNRSATEARMPKLLCNSRMLSYNSRKNLMSFLNLLP
jgi:hypothetical protein